MFYIIQSLYNKWVSSEMSANRDALKASVIYDLFKAMILTVHQTIKGSFFNFASRDRKITNHGKIIHGLANLLKVFLKFVIFSFLRCAIFLI